MTTFIRPEELSPEGLFSVLSWTVTPRPIAWVSTRNPVTGDNLAPFSFFTIASTDPALLMIAVEPNLDGSRKDTLTNIVATGGFVVHIAATTAVDDVAATADPSPPDFDEIAALGCATRTSQLVDAPIVAGAIAAFECELHETLQPGRETLVFGRVVGVHLDECVVDRSGRFLVDQLTPLARIGTTFAEIVLLDGHSIDSIPAVTGAHPSLTRQPNPAT